MAPLRDGAWADAATDRRTPDVGRTFDEITPEIAAFLVAQPVFFVATAPSAPTGVVNCSPKGLDTFRVVGPREVMYLDLTGSGAETIAHLRENSRATLMFCAFGGKPNIVRIYGHGEAIPAASPDAAPLLSKFDPLPGARSIIRIDVTRVSNSCGYGVPLLHYEDERPELLAWAERKGEAGLQTYRADNNARSIDGLPGLDREV
jgi:hypothetical protein